MAYEYLLLLSACLLVTLPLEVVLGVRVYRQPARLALAVAATAALFVPWDLAGHLLGHWDYVGERVVGLRVLGLPLEEYLFFVVVPVSAVLAYEAVVRCLPVTRRRLGALRPARRGRGDGERRG